MSNTTINCPHCKAERAGARITTGAQLPDEDRETRYFFVVVYRECDFPSIRHVPLSARLSTSQN
jgi:hypothetical protein